MPADAVMSLNVTLSVRASVPVSVAWGTTALLDLQATTVIANAKGHADEKAEVAKAEVAKAEVAKAETK